MYLLIFNKVYVVICIKCEWNTYSSIQNICWVRHFHWILFLHIFFVVTNSLMHNLTLPNFFAIISDIFVRVLILLYFICALHSNTQVKSSLILIYGWPFSLMSVSYKLFSKKIFEIHMIMFCRRFHFYEFSRKMILWMN